MGTIYIDIFCAVSVYGFNLREYVACVFLRPNLCVFHFAKYTEMNPL